MSAPMLDDKSPWIALHGSGAAQLASIECCRCNTGVIFDRPRVELAVFSATLAGFLKIHRKCKAGKP